MNNLKPWKKRKRTGGIKRKLSKAYAKASMEELRRNSSTDAVNIYKPVSFTQSKGSVQTNFDENIDFSNKQHFREPCCSKGEASLELKQSSVHFMNSDSDESELSTDEDNKEGCIFNKNRQFNNSIKKWAIKRNIAQDALKELAEIVNKRFPDILPKDPRTILQTARNITIKTIDSGGEYWHNGLIKSLTLVLNNWKDVCENIMSISLNINFDGLPIYKSSKNEFWPILGNVFEIPSAQPFIIGIYYGVGKPKNIDIYLEDFVMEMKQLLNEGIRLSSNKSITVKIRCFICDSPARAFIKGNEKRNYFVCNST